MIKRFAGWLALAGCAALLAACGGGGGSAGTTTGVGNGNTGATGEPSVKLELVDGTGSAVSTLSGGQSALLRATVTDANRAVAANAIVNFAASNAALVEFTPASASALTDAKGVAVVNIKPASFTAAGALTVSATAVVGTKSASASVNMAVGAAPLTVGTLSFSPPQSTSLPAFSTVALNIPVTSGGQPATSVAGLTMSSLCEGDGTATLVPGSLAGGIQSATYTNNGCLRGSDTITVSIANSTQTITIPVSPANIGTIKFIGSNVSGSSIVLRGSGGVGRSESAQLTFQVVDQQNNGLAGVDVSFRATTTTGGLTVSPTKATTDVAGRVMTIVTSGTIPTPVRVIAEATRSGVTISGLSDALTISTGLPIQKSMSMSADRYNIEGLNHDNEVANVTVLLADQYGNPVSDDTAVNFVTEGGAVGTSAQGACTTTNGGCTVALRSQEFRPVNGRVTVLAYVQGLENFIDTNGDGGYSCTTYRDAAGNVPSVYRPLVDTCVSGGEAFTDQGDAFLDAGNLAVVTGVPVGAANTTLDGTYTANNGDLPFPFEHTGYRSAGDGKWGINYISRSLEIVFSGSAAIMARQSCDNAGVCRDWVSATDGDPTLITGLHGAGCASQVLVFRLYDVNNNPLPFGTSVTGANADKVAPQTAAPAVVTSTNSIGGTFHSMTIKPDSGCAAGSFAVVAKTPKDLSTQFFFRSSN